MDASGVGRHAICEFWGARHLNSVERADQALRDAAVAGRVTLIDVFVHQFAPHGVSGIAMIAESHLAIHTWPEHGFVTIDVYVCNYTTDNSAKAERLLRAMQDAMKPQRVKFQAIHRGGRDA